MSKKNKRNFNNQKDSSYFELPYLSYRGPYTPSGYNSYGSTANIKPLLKPLLIIRTPQKVTKLSVNKIFSADGNRRFLIAKVAKSDSITDLKTAILDKTYDAYITHLNNNTPVPAIIRLLSKQYSPDNISCDLEVKAKECIYNGGRGFELILKYIYPIFKLNSDKSTTVIIEYTPKTYLEDINPWGVNLTPSPYNPMHVADDVTDTKDGINPLADRNINIPNDKKEEIISKIKNNKPCHYADLEKDATVGIIKISKKVTSVEDKPKTITVQVSLLIRPNEDEILVWFKHDKDFIRFLEIWSNDDILNRIFFVVDINIISYYDRNRDCWYEPKTLKDPEYFVSEVNSIRKCIRLTRPAKEGGESINLE